MLECLILGDSIAVGISQHRSGCVHLARGGINTSVYNRDYGPSMLIANMDYHTVIISLGTNDSTGMDTEGNIRRLRGTVQGKQVFWVLPSAERRPSQRQAVMKIAAEFRDAIISVDLPQLGADRIHPTGRGYQEIAQKTQ